MTTILFATASRAFPPSPKPRSPLIRTFIHLASLVLAGKYRLTVVASFFAPICSHVTSVVTGTLPSRPPLPSERILNNLIQEHQSHHGQWVLIESVRWYISAGLSSGVLGSEIRRVNQTNLQALTGVRQHNAAREVYKL